MAGAIDMAIDKDMLDQLLAGRDPQDLFAKDGLLDELKKALSERMLSAELDDHLENEGAEGAINRRNGSSRCRRTWSRRLPMLCWRRSRNGRAARLIPVTRWFFRRDPGRRIRPEQGRVHRAGDPARRYEGGPRHLDRADRGRQILA